MKIQCNSIGKQIVLTKKFVHISIKLQQFLLMTKEYIKISPLGFSFVKKRKLMLGRLRNMFPIVVVKNK